MNRNSEQLIKIFTGATIGAIVATLVGWIVFCGLESTTIHGYSIYAHLVVVLFGILGIPIYWLITFMYSLPLSLILWGINKIRIVRKLPNLIFIILSCLIGLSLYSAHLQLSSSTVPLRQNNKAIASMISSAFSGVALGIYYRRNKREQNIKPPTA